MNKSGLLLILSGASGAGKGTVLAAYLARHPEAVASVSVTTRAPRPGEQDGIHYFFRSRKQAERMIRCHAFLEHAEYNGNYYGTPKAPVEQWLAEGKDVFLEIDIQGAVQVMNNKADLVSVFIMPPSDEILEKRLRGRGTETEEDIQNRLAIAKKEMEQATLYEYTVVNDDLEAAVVALETIIREEKQKRGLTA